MQSDIDEIKKQFAELNERQKELKCLYNINTVLKDESLSLDEILSSIVMEIPGGYQFPDICQAQIILEGKETSTEDLRPTELKQIAKIKLKEHEIGEIRVYYTEPVKTPTGRVFLFEEQKLIDTIAESISQYITIQRFQDLMKESLAFSGNLNIPITLGKWLADFQLNQEQVKALLTTRISFRKGELILKQGGHASYVVMLTEGLAKAYVEDLNGRSFAFNIAKPYEFIGLSSLFGNGTHGFSTSAILQSSGFLIRKETLKSLMKENPEFSFQILKWQSRNFENLYHKINILSNKQALGRMADALLYLWEQVFDKKLIENTITRKIIAEFSGMSNENGVRILSELKSEGIIRTNVHGIEVLNPEKLRTYILVS